MTDQPNPAPFTPGQVDELEQLIEKQRTFGGYAYRINSFVQKHHTAILAALRGQGEPSGGGNMKQSCQTCSHWGAEEIDYFRQCLWPRPILPFWAAIDEGLDHADWTVSDDGRRCQTFSGKETP